jgi:hypothetical protein
MLRLLLIPLVGAVLAGSATAAEVNPARLVLQRTDVPAGFRLDAQNSGPSSNAHERSADLEQGRLFIRAGRVSGYIAEYKRSDLGVNSRVDLYRAPSGAHTVLWYFDRVLRTEGIKGLRRSPVDLGSEAWVHAGPSGTLAVVVWRRGRVVAGLATIGLTRPATLRLARAQDRRIATALGS